MLICHQVDSYGNRVRSHCMHLDLSPTSPDWTSPEDVARAIQWAAEATAEAIDARDPNLNLLTINDIQRLPRRFVVDGGPDGPTQLEVQTRVVLMYSATFAGEPGASP